MRTVFYFIFQHFAGLRIDTDFFPDCTVFVTVLSNVERISQTTAALFVFEFCISHNAGKDL